MYWLIHVISAHEAFVFPIYPASSANTQPETPDQTAASNIFFIFKIL